MDAEKHGFLQVFWKAFKIFVLGFLAIVITGLILSGSIAITGSINLKIIIKMLLGIGITWAFVYLLENIIFNIVGMQSREIKEQLHRIEYERLSKLREDLDDVKTELKYLKKKIQDSEPQPPSTPPI